jgi:hypothetical protein
VIMVLVGRSRVCFPKGQEIFFPQDVQTSSGGYPPSCSVRTEGSVLEVKWAEREVDYSRPSSVKVKKEWGYTSMPPCAFMACTGRTFVRWTLRLINLTFNDGSVPLWHGCCVVKSISYQPTVHTRSKELSLSVY